MKKVMFVALVAGLSLNAIAQGLISETIKQETPSCGSHAYMEHIDHQNPGFMKLANTHLQDMSTQVVNQKAKKGDDEILEVQVVFHVVYNNAEENIGDSVFEDQISVLNECFRRQNADTSNLRPAFDGLVGDALINFKLATEDPMGNPTNGVTRTSTSIEYFGGVLPYGQGQNAEIVEWINDTFYRNISRISQSDKGGMDPWDTDRYLNVWVGDLRILEPKVNNAKEILFFALATPPVGHRNFQNQVGLDELFEVLEDGVLMHYPIVGPNNPVLLEAPYNGLNGIITEGEMLVHETGHYLGLRHIWGDGPCSADDFIDDTPKTNNSSQYVCNSTRNTCVDTINGVDLPDMIENYMDYSGSSCMNSFTKGQIWVMREVVRRGRTSFVSTEKLNNDFFNVYPNPSRTGYTVNLNRFSQNTTFSVLNMQGKVVDTGIVKSQKFKLEINALPGIYFLEVRNGDIVQRTRVMKL
ncbi:MAG: hypothetical protein COA58_12060 [Bacteroidetes bacterium]|nr:MAG: hypothetical protein COA58_12060 [Bacteroidota bacterium]